MEGLQGFGWGLILASLGWLSVLLVGLSHAYHSGHIAGQQTQIDKAKNKAKNSWKEQ